MARKYGFRPSLREQRTSVVAAMKFMALGAPADKRYAAQAMIAEAAAMIKPKRERAAPRQLEAPVITAISELLAVHPKILFAVRQNSGAAMRSDARGKLIPVRFYRILTSQPVVITDFWGILRDGRMFACEAKAPGFTHPTTDREFKQAAFIQLVRNCGGVALFATDCAQVADALK